MNVSRRLPDNTVNEKEPNQQCISMTSAGSKTTFAYTKLLDVLETAIIDPRNAFFFGCDYRVPMLHGLLDANFINKLKTSPSYNEESFAREYLSLWSGGSDESWFNYDRMIKYRKIKNPENHAIYRGNSKQFYLLSVDVGRLHDQTVCCVFRVNILNNVYYATLVNIKVLGLTPERKTLRKQAIDIKKIIKDFNPQEVVIDTNGLGIGLADEMIISQIDDDGIEYPPYSFNNNDDYKKIQSKSAPAILYSMKANSTLKPLIHSNTYNRISSGKVHFLIKEQEAKSALLATESGRKKTPEEKIKRLMPHELTTKLFNEMLNFRLKKTSATDIVLEPINTKYPDDKYMAFAYGLWRIKELEEENFKRIKRGRHNNNSKRRFSFVSDF